MERKKILTLIVSMLTLFFMGIPNAYGEIPYRYTSTITLKALNTTTNKTEDFKVVFSALFSHNERFIIVEDFVLSLPSLQDNVDSVKIIVSGDTCVYTKRNNIPLVKPLDFTGAKIIEYNNGKPLKTLEIADLYSTHKVFSNFHQRLFDKVRETVLKQENKHISHVYCSQLHKTYSWDVFFTWMVIMSFVAVLLGFIAHSMFVAPLKDNIKFEWTYIFHNKNNKAEQ